MFMCSGEVERLSKPARAAQGERRAASDGKRVFSRFSCLIISRVFFAKCVCVGGSHLEDSDPRVSQWVFAFVALFEAYPTPLGEDTNHCPATSLS